MNEDSQDAGSVPFNLDQLAEAKLNKNRTVPHSLDLSRQIVPIFVFTAIFGLIFIIAPFLVRRGPNRSIIRVCIMLSTVCCWIFWTTTYIVQMNPLLGPRLSNHSLAWIGHKWGKDAAVLKRMSLIVFVNKTNGSQYGSEIGGDNDGDTGGVPDALTGAVDPLTETVDALTETVGALTETVDALTEAGDALKEAGDALTEAGDTPTEAGDEAGEETVVI